MKLQALLVQVHVEGKELPRDANKVRDVAYILTRTADISQKQLSFAGISNSRSAYIAALCALAISIISNLHIGKFLGS